MNYLRFIEQLLELYENWGQSSVRPKSEQFQAIIAQISGKTTANIMQLLNFAVECMEPDEVYCQVGCFEGVNLIGALLNHPESMAYAVDNFSEFDISEEKIEQLSNNLSLFDLEQQVFFCNQDFEEFFFDLREIKPDPKIGIYLYDGSHDYRSQLLGLLLAKPFLADKALIIVDDSNWSTVQQASWDFMAAHPQCQLLLDLPTPKDGHGTFWNGIHVLSWDVDQETNYSWSAFEDNFRDKALIKKIYNSCLEFNEKQITVVNSLYQQALLLEDVNQDVEAEKKYREIIDWNKNYAPAWNKLGIIYYQREQCQDALAMLIKSLELDPSIGQHHYSLGLVLEKLGLTSQAIEAYEKAISLDNQLVDAYNNLGNILSKIGLMEQSELIYRQAIEANPQHFGSYINLGNMLMARHLVDEAIEIYKKSLELQPHNPDILHNLGVAFEAKKDLTQSSLYFGYAAYYNEKYEAAIIYYQKVLEHKVGDLDLYVALGYCYRKTNQQELVIKTYQEGIKYYPNQSYFYLLLIDSLQSFGQTEEAIYVTTEALRLLPNNIDIKLENIRLLPILYETSEEIDFYRHRFEKHLEILVKEISLNSIESINDAFIGIGFRTNFFLQYQGKNDVKLQSLYGQFVYQVMSFKYPQWVKPVPMLPLSKEGKIRVGYVSNSFYFHTVGQLFKGWLKNSNRQYFQVYCYSINSRTDSKTQDFQRYSHAFYQIPNDLEAICKQIISDQLHILIFLDIGMEPKIAPIASLRLAPVQCMTWGHPITSGLLTIDYFLSSDLMEPENAEEHYSEKLVRLPNIGISYEKPLITEARKKRSEFQLHDDAVVYLCCQSLFKYLPQYDYIFAEIAQRVPQTQFVFVGSQINDSITEKFLLRLQKAFDNLGLDSKDYCLMSPRINHMDYLNLNLVSDIFLDTFSWSGGNTMLEAIACNLPVVTCPGKFMRGRHSYGILKMLGVTETIAQDEAEYIEIAVRLGLDKEWRKSIVEKIVQNHDHLYDDKTCVEALEEFYQRVVQEGQLANTTL